MSVDMGGIAWPVHGATAGGVQVGQVTLERRTAYVGSPLGVTAVGTDGQPYIGALTATLTGRDSTVSRPVSAGSFSTAGVLAGKYRVTVNGVPAGNLIIL